jgi:YD repeat-containing protein
MIRNSGAAACAVFPNTGATINGGTATSGSVSVTNAKGETYSLTYDLAGQLVEEVGFDGRRLTFEYDAAGHAIGRTDAEGPATRFRRDAMGRLLERLYPDGTADRFAYDPSGALIEAANAHRVVRFGYGRAGELLEEHQDGHVLRHTVDARRRRTGTAGCRAGPPKVSC